MDIDQERVITMGDRLAYFFLRLFICLSKVLPKSWLYAMLKMLTMLFYFTNKRRRSITIDNLQQAFPELSADEVKKVSKEVYIELSKTITEILLMLANRFDVDEAVINAESAHQALEVLRQKYPQGEIVITAHFSNWELAAHFLSQHGHKMLAVGREGDNPVIDQKLTIPFRQRYGNRSVYKKGAAIAVVKALKKGEIVGVLIDQKVNRSEGVKVKFFGREVYTTSLVANMKNRLNVAVIPIFLPRVEDGKYRLVVGDPIETSGCIEQMTQSYNDAMEKIIRAYPAQWFWMHNRWKV